MKSNGSQRPTHPSHYHPYTTPAAKVAADNSLRSNATPEIARGVIKSGRQSLLPSQQDNTLRKPDNLPDPEHIISQSAQNPNLVKKPEQVQLSMHISALKCTVSWEFPALMAQLKYTQKIEVNSGDMRPVTNSKWMEAHITTFQFQTVPGKIYSIRLRIVDDRRVVVARGCAKCKAVFSREEMDKLMDKAVTSIGNSSKMKEFHDLQRCKPSHYWEHIRLYGNGIMRVYTKDNNGQAASPINGQIKGLFFFATLEFPNLKSDSSPLGDTKMVLKASNLLNPDSINLYFSDYYCFKVTHYVTIVVCNKGSTADRFCSQHLKLLRTNENPFLK
uniref:Phytanoyl-CoA hydroxylase-interacting protein-like C-terminal domain-containing protein n=1 Tax=Ditylenchus dipsaci TaxID=166011 RepID=A0A915ESS8_9BILA